MTQSLASWVTLGRDVEDKHEEAVFVGPRVCGGGGHSTWQGKARTCSKGPLPRVRLPRVCPGG